jgi:hypothetical protein
VSTKFQTKEYLKYTFSPDETRVIGQRLADAAAAVENIKLRKKEVTKQLDSEIAKHETEVSQLARQIREGYEFRDVPCDVYYHHPREGWKTTYRTDTGAEVKCEAMSPYECQQSLFEQPEQAEPSAPTDEPVVIAVDAETTLSEAVEAVAEGESAPDPIMPAEFSVFDRYAYEAEGAAASILLVDLMAGWSALYSARLELRHPRILEETQTDKWDSREHAIAEAAVAIKAFATDAAGKATMNQRWIAGGLLIWASELINRVMPPETEEKREVIETTA